MKAIYWNFLLKRRLTYKVGEQTLASVLELLTANQVREETLYIIEDLIDINEEFFDLLDEKAIHVSGSNRYEIPMSNEINKLCAKASRKG